MYIEKGCVRLSVISPQGRAAVLSVLHAGALFGEGVLAGQRHRRSTADAVTAFREAAELRPNWPDPFLGLARTFIYGLEDVDRGADALTQAQRFGYTPGDRETTQLADGYRARADTLARTARTLSGLAQEQEYLTRAAEAYRRALDLYAKVVSFADVARTMRLTQRALVQVEQRIADLSKPAVQPSSPQNPTAVDDDAQSRVAAAPYAHR